jgi:hypothetical protein
VRHKKSKTLKLAPTLAQYLYDRKKLSLPGIGSFSFDSTFRTEADLKYASQGISFQSNTSVVENDDLINYISAQTGKMRSLASADFESYLELAIQFLNIGKPFHIEGVGTLVKTKSGGFEFTADHLLSDKVKESGIKELSATSISDQSLTTYESLKPQKETNPPYRKIFLIVLIAVTAGIIIYGGYRIYKSNTADDDKKLAIGETNSVANDSNNTVTPIKPDSVQPTAATPVNNAVQQYRFVIEEAGRNRAFYRYHMLKKGNIPVQMSTSDSISFKLFIVIPAMPKDTARIADSLTIFYPAVNRKRAYVEK